MASLRITQHPGMSPGQKIPHNIDCVVIDDDVGRIRLMPDQQIPLDIDCFVIGRESDCHLAIPDPTVSKRHAELRLENRQWSIEDLRTRNGTWVNGQRIQGRTPLSHNDEIHIPASALPACTAVFENV
jgi:pSer/pThr/pTyr-binding forkhead associated (FHA) protein